MLGYLAEFEGICHSCPNIHAVYLLLEFLSEGRQLLGELVGLLSHLLLDFLVRSFDCFKNLFLIYRFFLRVLNTTFSIRRRVLLEFKRNDGSKYLYGFREFIHTRLGVNGLEGFLDFNFGIAIFKFDLLDDGAIVAGHNFLNPIEVLNHVLSLRLDILNYTMIVRLKSSSAWTRSLGLLFAHRTTHASYFENALSPP